MNKKKTLKTVFLIGVAGGFIVGGVIFYLVIQPLRDVQNTTTNYTLSATTIYTKTRDVIIPAPVQGYEFPIALMQKRYNGKYFWIPKHILKQNLKANPAVT